MKKFFTSLTVLCLASVSAFAQMPEVGTPAYAAWINNQSAQRQGGPAVQPQNGSDTLNMVYSNTACGLNYSLTSVRLGQRFQPVGLPQPAPMNVNSIPACGTVLQAYLYTEALGVTPAITATLTDPSNNSTSVPMSLIGSSVDVCWGMGGTHMWRADVTNLISGGGTYTISGLPTSLASNSAVDVEGATLLIIYADPTASYTGSIQIDDGCHTVPGGLLTHNMTGFNACANSTSGSAFMLVGDMQMSGYYISMNGSGAPQSPWNWWNELSVPTNVTAGQNSCSYQLGSSSDCFTLGVAGLYYQSNCSNCTPTQVGLTVTASGTNANCGNNGTATATATGGNGNYTYVWIPGNQTTATATGLAAGTYTVMVTDGTTCGTATVSIANTGMVTNVTSIGSSCVSSSGSAAVSVTGGTAPYSYAWSPTGGNAASASNLAPGNYTCTITDQTSCSIQVTVNVASPAALTATVWCNPDSCPSPTGSAYAWPSGGNGPFTYLWSNNSTASYLTGLTPGIYCCTITDAAGCTASSCDTVVSAPGSFYAYTTGYAYAQCGDSVQLDAYSSDPTATYAWSPSASVANPNSSSTMAFTAVNTTYYVSISGQCGSAFDSVMVIVDTTNYYSEQICFVTVDTASNHNLVIWERTNSPSSGSYNIYRETAVAGNYALIATQPISQFTTYLDVTSNPIVMANRYVITTVDPCGNESDTSLHHRSIHLQVSPSPFGGWNLAWTAYEGLPIATYNIYRGTNISNMTLLTQVAGNVFTYTDVTAPVGPVWYMIEAVHPNGGCNPSRWSAPGHTFDYSSMLSNFEYADPQSVNDNSALQNSLTLSPNPGNGIFSLNCNVAAGENVNITITDALGRVVYTSTDANQGSAFHKEMDLSALAAGVYNVQVNNGANAGVTKLVITQ
jgi:hypothetical protein